MKLKKKNNKKEDFNLKEEYKKCWDYIKDSKKFIYIIILIFFVFVLIGFFFPLSDSFVKQILDFLKELLEKTQGMSQGELVRFIFLNNLQSSFYGMLFGVFFGIFPIIVTITNGYLLGFVSSTSVQSGGILSLWKLLPHGIFELLAVFISLGLGLKLGVFIFQEKKIEYLKLCFLNSLRVFLLVVIPLLFIAGIIEGSLIFFCK